MTADSILVGVFSLVLALGHAVVGRFWVIPNLPAKTLPATPFGPPSLTASMLRFTWHAVTLQLLGFGVLFLVLGSDPHLDTKVVVLRWFAAISLAATITAVFESRRSPKNLIRFPVPILFLLCAVLSWTGSI